MNTNMPGVGSRPVNACLVDHFKFRQGSGSYVCKQHFSISVFRLLGIDKHYIYILMYVIYIYRVLLCGARPEKGF